MWSSGVVLLVPVKDGPATKSRLGGHDAADRQLLMTAFAQDALAAAQDAGPAEVVVVGRPEWLDLPRVRSVPDQGRGDLNRALREAAAAVPDRYAVAAMLADLPCLRAADLAGALAEAERIGGRCFVADADGRGTSLLVAAPGVPLDPLFGRDSARRHRDSGATALTGALATLRRDVDTADDLRAAEELGLGPRTARALDRVRTAGD